LKQKCEQLEIRRERRDAPCHASDNRRTCRSVSEVRVSAMREAPRRVQLPSVFRSVPLGHSLTTTLRVEVPLRERLESQ
jgi:hypothetical protein